MGMADIAEALWNDFLQHNPRNPKWPNRDRFVLSNGHGSMLIYSLLHLTGYDLSLEDIKSFRQFDSKTPGHPEYGYTPGVETTTGPLGQGITNAVGMAIAERTLGAQFNTSEHKIVDHYTYTFMGDGCLMEGISHEACSLAGTLGLGKLVAFWDDNGISIDGEVEGWFTDDTPARFRAYGWQVIDGVDGHDGDAIANAIEQAREETSKPTLICCKTIIGKGNYLYFGVREFAMSAICNGIALYGGFKSYAATFLVFSDYMRNGMRMSALMKQPVIYVLTHDSIGLGEDGPTHQPVEHVASLRLIPNMSLWRPCDSVESLVAWKMACQTSDKPSSLIFSRQGLPHQDRTSEQIRDIEKGAYVLKDTAGEPDLILIATGSEVALAMESAEKLEQQGTAVRVVSMPSTDHFDAQSDEYKESVLPFSITKRIAIEAGIADYWYKYVGINGAVIGMSSFGESAPAEELFEHYGFNVDNVVAIANNLIS
ncbi:UNVERIFIED_CONTAM: hypothetical protein GTU68_014313 [Idotea baltica]|nr:hypothetical protein [Idotea baltica]